MTPSSRVMKTSVKCYMRIFLAVLLEPRLHPSFQKISYVPNCISIMGCRFCLPFYYSHTPLISRPSYGLVCNPSKRVERLGHPNTQGSIIRQSHYREVPRWRFLSSPIACVACELTELLRTEISGGGRRCRFCCASKLFQNSLALVTLLKL